MSLVSWLLSIARARVTMMAPCMSRTRRWLRLRGMTKVTAQRSISLDGCYAGPMDPRDPHRRRDLHVLTRLLGDGTCLYDVAGGSVCKLQNLGRR